MKFKILVGVEDGSLEPSWETYTENTDDPEKWGKDIVDYFNSTLRPHEAKRKYFNFEILDGEESPHSWEKDATGMSMEFRGEVVDVMYCKKCGITGKRKGLSSHIKIDSKYKKKAYRLCNTAKKEMQK